MVAIASGVALIQVEQFGQELPHRRLSLGIRGVIVLNGWTELDTLILP